MKARWQDTRKLTKRVVITAQLELLSPARLGNGDTDELTDMPLARDAKEGKALLAGSSIAGALRNYAREWLYGYGQLDRAETNALFGEVSAAQVSRESRLIVDDALADVNGLELRDGVTIDPETRTAETGKLFNYELLEAGTHFPVRFELALPENSSDLLSTLAVALTGFERGEVGLGARKRRGLGACEVKHWRVETYDVTSGTGLLDWLESRAGETVTGPHIAQLLGVTLPQDGRQRFTVDATFRLESSLLIRSGSGDGNSPDMVHLTSKRNGKAEPILSGTSLAGAARARAHRIAHTIAPQQADSLIDGMFGPRFGNSQKDRAATAKGSRVTTYESVVEHGLDRVQSRVKIDRFTGGSYPSALFDQQPVYGGRATQVHVRFELRNPLDAEIGLLLQVLKDLWTGDLPLGGESSVGRGRLHGLTATLTFGEQRQWKIAETDGALQFSGTGTPAHLERFAAAVGGG